MKTLKQFNYFESSPLPLSATVTVILRIAISGHASYRDISSMVEQKIDENHHLMVYEC